MLVADQLRVHELGDLLHLQESGCGWSASQHARASSANDSSATLSVGNNGNKYALIMWASKEISR